MGFVARRWMGRALLLGLLLITAANAAERADDRFLQGYVAAILEQQLGWAAGTFQVYVRGRIVTVVMNADDPVQREKAERALAHIDDVEQVHIVVSSAVPQAENQPVVFPAGDLFRPLIADPKQPQFFV